MSRPNILFIVMDTARARDTLPSTNTELVPELAELADEGVEFTSAISTAPWTLPSHASLFTGQYTSQHSTNAGNKRFSPTHKPLARLLSNSGYSTVAFSNNSWIAPEFGFDDGFDEFFAGWKLFDSDDELPRVMREFDEPLSQFSELLKSTELKHLPTTVANAIFTKYLRRRYDYGALLTNWKVRRWLDNWNGSKPFFMFINYLEPHLKYDPPKKYCDLPEGVSTSEAKQINQSPWEYVTGETQLSDRELTILEHLYRSEIGYLDHRIGELLDLLSTYDSLENTLIVVVGDHGENIGDHGLMDHQYCLYDTLIHVPLIIRGPNNFKGGKQVTDVVESRYIFPTILEAAGVDIPKHESVADESLSIFVQKDSESRTNKHAIAEYLVPQPDLQTLRSRVGGGEQMQLGKYDRALRCVRTNKWKYIEYSDGSHELYDIVNDSRENSDISSEYSEISRKFCEELRETCGTLQRGEQGTGDVDTAAQQRLKDLGYI
ncbi:sulfatase [Salinigranum marinum]|uniref:sulfatase n=1 Tax=Salinigranum marinum TaxID=1515595 RepID=UPI002989A3C6|nr:sulfatase [Salinigranum marinum]